MQSNNFNKPLHLLLDGVDNVGKTTVVNLLSRKLDLPIVKMPGTIGFIKDETIEKVSELYNETIVQFRESSFILDRGFTSSLVYNEVFQRKGQLDYIESIEAKLRPKIFIFTRMSEKNQYVPLCEDPIFNYEEKERINKEFLQLATRKEYYIVNTYDKSPEEVCNEIIKEIEKDDF